MKFSKIDISLFSGSKVASEQASFNCLNPLAKAGSLLFLGASAERAALGGQVAAKLALSKFIEGFFTSATTDMQGEENVNVIELAYNKANSGVYEFGHKLSAGGRMSASVVSVFINGGCIYASRVGQGQAYLSRDSQAFPFFSNHQQGQDFQTLGSNSLVSVEIATVDLQPGDVIFILSEPLKTEDEAEISHLIGLLLPKFQILDASGGQAEPTGQSYRSRLEPGSCKRLVEQLFDSDQLAFAAIIGIGPKLNFLSKPEKLAA
jgi:hypothetical protein